MKMETNILATADGIVDTVFVNEGQQVKAGELGCKTERRREQIEKADRSLKISLAGSAEMEPAFFDGRRNPPGKLSVLPV